MTREEIAERAVEYKHTGYNCSQAVIQAIADEEGADCANVLTMTSGFAVGMGTMETTCGAIIGANLMAGLKTNGQGTIMKAKEMFRQFEFNCGASICKDLKGRDTGVVICPCDDCVRNAVYAYVDALSEE